jgi:hypothetical protein
MMQKPSLLVCVTLWLFSVATTVGQQAAESARWKVINPASTELAPQLNPYTRSQLNAVKRYVQPKALPRIVHGERESYLVPGNIRVHPSTITTQTEVPITRHPTNANIMFGSSNAYRPGTGFISEGVYVTTNGGISWFGSDTLAATPLTGHSGDPAPAIDKDGRFIETYLGGSTGMQASYSTNLGATWAPSLAIPGGSSSDKNLSGTDDAPSSPFYGRTYTVWTNFGGSFANRIVISYTTNGGGSWSSASPVSPPTSSGHHHQGCDVRVGPTGQVYVVWANCTTNGQESTEDSLGFARSTDGGVTWAYSTNRAIDMNGIRTQSFGGYGIRVAGFPRIDIDRSGGPRNGWIFVTACEKNVAPATDLADATCMRSTDGGNTWTKIRVNQDTPGNGKKQFMSAIRVDEAGGVNVVYYDSRNIATNDSAEVFVSRSLDGGTTWSDILASDHRFKPKPIPGLAGGYQGDYIGITSGNGKMWPYWMDDSPGLYQAWTVGITTTENFGWVKGTVTNASGGSVLGGVTVDFTDPIPNVPGTSDGTGFFKAGAKVDTPATTRNVTMRARKFGFRDTLLEVTIIRNDTVTRNFPMSAVPSGTLVVRTVRKDSTNVRSVITVLFAGSPVSSGNTDSLTGIYSTSLPIGTYDVLADPPSPYGNRQFNGVAITGGSNPLYVVVRAVVENSPGAMRDTLATGQVHAKTLQLTNTTATDTVSYRLGDDNSLARMRVSKPAVRPREVPVVLPEAPKGSADAIRGEDQRDGSGGPDAFGYRWVDSDSIGGGVSYNWVEISSVGTPVTAWSGGTDDGSYSTTLPWSFPFYGNSYTNLFFTTNGWIGFNTPSTQYTNVGVPNNAEPNNAVYAWWDDLDAVGTSGDRTVYFYNDLANSRYIVEWNNVRYLSATTDTLKFQAILRPNGEILLQYNRMLSPSNLTTATIGIENADGSTGLQIVYNAAYIHSSLAVRFYLPDAPWLSENPSFGRINPGATQDITVTFDATSLLTGTTYNGRIILDLTHPDVTGSILVPASLKVNPASGPVIILSKTSIVFPATEIGASRLDSLAVRNGGSTTLSLPSITSTNSHFTVSPSNASIGSGDSVRVRVTYSAGSPAHNDTGRVIILSNDPLTPRTDIILSGSSIGVAHMVALPDTFYYNLPAGPDTTRTTFKVFNTGTDTLRYQINESNTSTLDVATIERSKTQQRVLSHGKGAPNSTPGEGGTDSQGGPDVFGYRWIDSDEPGGPTYNWVDISGVGMPITGWAPTADDGIVTVSLPWSFSFYGSSYTNVTVCTNGWVSFVSTTTEYSNTAIPTTATPNGAIYAIWDDLDLRTSGTVHYYNDTANQRFIIQYTGVPFYSGAGTATFQIILHQNGTIRTQYSSIVGQLTSSTIGIENQSGTVALQVVYNASYLHDNLAILFTGDVIPWMSTDRTSGTVAPGDSQSVQLRIHPVGLTSGLFTGYQKIAGNSSDTARVRVRLNTNTTSAVTVTNPNGGEVWSIGQTYPLVWTKVGAVDSVRIEFSTDGPGGTWIQINAAVPARGGPDTNQEIDGRANEEGGRDNPNGTYNWTVPAGAASTNCFVRVSWKSNPSVNDMNNAAFTIQQTSSGDTTIFVTLASGWNLISNPVTNPVPGDSLRQLFPRAMSVCPFAFNGGSGYVVDCRLGNGIGYWAKFPGAEVDTIRGTVRPRDSMSVTTGWNMVGSISRTVDTSTIISVPPGLRSSNWFGYTSGYAAVSQIVPGKGYWVKSSGTGKLVLAGSTLANPVKVQGSGAIALDVLNTLTVADSKGAAQTLYFGTNAKDEIPTGMFDMPPAPPLGAFDARFETSEGGSMVQAHGGEGAEFTVAIQSDAYPVTVTWNVKDASYELTAEVGSVQTMRGKGTMRISNSEVNRLFLKLTGAGELPKEFALRQNYPNPFNPSTTIKYALPTDSRVSLKLFNILGQEVLTLVNEEQKAGYKSVEWNALNFASGVYFYRLQAGDFVSSKKLLLLK